MDNIRFLKTPTTKWTSNVKEVYEAINSASEPLKIRLKDCPWEGIVYVYTKLEAGSAPDQKGAIPTKFEYRILDESEGFTMDLFKIDVQMIMFENLLGEILKDVLADLHKEHVQEPNEANDRIEDPL